MKNQLIIYVYKYYKKIYESLKMIYKRHKWRSSIKKNGKYRVLSKEQIKECKNYWRQYTKHFSIEWHQLFTAKTGVFDIRYIPEDFQFLELEPKVNNKLSDYGIDDKNNYKMYFPEVKHPKSVFRKMQGIYHDDDYNIITEEQAIKNCIESGNVIFKLPKLYGIGEGIRFWIRDDGIDKLESIIYEMGNDINAQEYIQQHPNIAKMNPSSCNTIRLMTYYDENGVRVLNSYFQVGMNPKARMGQINIGGVCVSINNEGKLYKYAYDSNYNKYDTHSSGIKFENYEIPSYTKVCNAAIKLHRKLGDFRLVSWDFSVDNNGDPIFIEMNLHEGGIMFHQLSKGPLYGEQTEMIIDSILNRNNNN